MLSFNAANSVPGHLTAPFFYSLCVLPNQPGSSAQICSGLMGGNWTGGDFRCSLPHLYGFIAHLIYLRLSGRLQIAVLFLAVSLVTAIAFSRIYIGAYFFRMSRVPAGAGHLLQIREIWNGLRHSIVRRPNRKRHFRCYCDALRH